MKKLLSLFLALMLLFTVSACGDTGKPQEITEWYSEETIQITEKQIKKIVSKRYTAPKNIILVIGDGMGPNDIAIAEAYSKDAYDFGLVLNRIPNHGLATTHSASAAVTDSAASGTALSTGVKTTNGYIGKAPDGSDLMTMAERARQAGKKVGIITNEEFYGATPSAFTVHSLSRNNHTEIVNSFVRFMPDVLMGCNFTSIYRLCDEEGRQILMNDCLLATRPQEFKEVLSTDPQCTKPFIGFNAPYLPKATDDLAQCMQVALNRLSYNNEEGFFLMLEGSGTDKYGHGNAIDEKIANVVTLDRAVAAALLFMEDNPDTLLVITSDHETGGVQMPASAEEITNDLFTTDSHTDTPVRVFAVGKGSNYFKDTTVDNTDIANFLIRAIEGGK